MPFIALTTWTGIPDTGHGVTGLSLEGGEEADDDDNIAYETVLVGEGDGSRMVGVKMHYLRGKGRAWVGLEEGGKGGKSKAKKTTKLVGNRISGNGFPCMLTPQARSHAEHSSIMVVNAWPQLHVHLCEAAASSV